MTRFILLLAFVSLPARAFLPPVPAMVREVFELRKPRKATEVILRHHVTVRPGELVEIEERMAAMGGRPQFLWKVNGQVFSGNWDRKSYLIEGEKSIPSPSAAFLKYFLSTSADEYLGVLVYEQYVRRDQLAQFKPGWVPEGDPNLWPVKENYLNHPDIFLHRLRFGTAIEVVGTEEGANRRAVYFDQRLKGIRRLEWREGPQSHTWEFDLFSPIAKVGVYPKLLYYEQNGEERIRSELVAVRAMTDRQVSEFVGQVKHSPRPLTQSLEAALQMLLGSR